MLRSARIGAVLAVSLATLVAACAKTEAAPEAEKSGSPDEAASNTSVQAASKLPEAIARGQIGSVADTTIQIKNVQDVQSTPKSDKPGPGQKLLAIAVEIKAVGGYAMYSGSLFDVVGISGKRYSSSILPCTDAALGSGSLDSGKAKTGDLCFLVPKEAKGLQLMFKSGGKDALPFTL